MHIAIINVQFAICILMSGSGEGAKIQSMVHEIKIISRNAPETGKKKDTYSLWLYVKMSLD